MIEEEYKKLNNYLNDIFMFLEKKDSFFLRNIFEIAMLNTSFLEFINKYNLKDETIKNKLSFEEVYLLAREIIESLNKYYLEDFDKLIQTGQLDFSYDSEYIGSYYEKINGINVININREFNYSDVRILVHEFIHYINSKNFISTKGYLFSEFLSIYFELYTIDYLIDIKGIPKNEISYNDRLLHIKDISEFLDKHIVILLAYEKFGAIDKNTIKLINENYLSENYTEEMFNSDCHNLLKGLQKTEEEYKKSTIDVNEEELISTLASPFSKIYRYILGSLLAFYSRKYCNVEDIVYLNNHVIDYDIIIKNISDVLKMIGIDIYEDNFKDKVFDSIDDYINKYNDLKKK